MRILFIHDRFGAQAGAESNLYHTAAELKRRGHEVGLAHGPGTGAGEDEWRALFASRFTLNAGETASGVRAGLAAFRPDVAYLHNPPDTAAVAALAAAGRPVVRMVHDHQLFCLRGCKYPIWSRRPCPRALSPYCVFPCGGAIGRNGANGRRSLHWVSYTEKKRELRLHRGFHRLVVGSEYMRTELLRNGFDFSQIELHAPVPPAGLKAESTFRERNLIVYAGQIVRGKGVDALLRALARVRTPFECAILGDGGHRPYCETLSRRLGLAGQVHFHGYVPQETLVRYYREASVAAVSSLWPEPFGATGLEAMRCGLPVVAFDAGGIEEWLHDGVNGFLVPWMDCGRYAACIDSLLADKTLARSLGAEGRALAEKRFSFQSYADGLERLFSRVLREEVQEVAV